MMLTAHGSLELDKVLLVLWKQCTREEPVNHSKLSSAGALYSDKVLRTVQKYACVVLDNHWRLGSNQTLSSAPVPMVG